MKRFIVLVVLGLVVLGWILSPLAVTTWRRHQQGQLLAEQPTYQGQKLETFIRDIQADSLTGPAPEAVHAKQGVQAIGPAAIPWLIKWMKPPFVDSTMPGAAMEAFRALGERAKSAIPELASMVTNPPGDMNGYSSQHYAAEALCSLGPDAIPTMLAAITNFNGQHLQWELIQDLGAFGTNGAVAIPAIIGWAHDSDSWVRLGVVNALGAIASEPEVVVPLLRQALNDPDDLVRRDAASALENFNLDTSTTVPALIKALDDPSVDVRTSAIEALTQLSAQRDLIVPLMVKRLRDDNKSIRRIAAWSLGNLGGKEAFDGLLQALDDAGSFEHGAIVQALEHIDAKALEKSGKKID